MRINDSSLSSRSSNTGVRSSIVYGNSALDLPVTLPFLLQIVIGLSFSLSPVVIVKVSRCSLFFWIHLVVLGSQDLKELFQPYLYCTGLPNSFK